MSLSRRAPCVIVCAVLVVLAGCPSEPAGPETPPTAAPLPNTATTPLSGNVEQDITSDLRAGGVISVVNNRSIQYIVEFRVFRGRVDGLRLTLTDGSTHTVYANDTGKNPVQDSVGNLSLYVTSRRTEISRIEPVRSAEIARWSGVLNATSAVSLPVPAERHNVTYLIVVREPTDPHPTKIELQWCEPPSTLDELTIDLLEDRRSHDAASCTA